LKRSVDKGKISSDDEKAILALIHPSTDMANFKSADFVVEAASEVEEIKFKIFSQLDEICPAHAILSSNTSSIPIGRIASQTKRPEKVIGMHFMNPVPVMKLVEVIRALPTSDETFQATVDLAELMGKTPAVANDFPGFIANRILLPMINEAIFCLYQGVGDAESIDTVMKLGMNHPMGPLALADLIGLDTCLAILNTLHQGLGDPKYSPCPLLRQYVESGWLGRKSGRGFYTY
jgi:3-hydroxybutyryl-CoA dehydrogenase